MSSSRVPVAHAEPADDVLAHRVRPARDSRGASRAGDNGSSDEDNDNVEAGMISSNSPQDEERVVVESLPGGYQVVAVEASRVDVVTAAPAGRGDANVWVRQNRDLLPYPSEGRWHYDLMERCCTFDGNCAMAWFCAVFPVAQIAERLKAMGIMKQGYHDVLFVSILWMVADLLISAATKEDSWSFYIYLSLVCCQFRGVIRMMLKIPGSAFDDCLVSCLCQPCVVTQMVGTLWVNPREVPGCSFDERAAYVV